MTPSIWPTPAWQSFGKSMSSSRASVVSSEHLFLAQLAARMVGLCQGASETGNVSRPSAHRTPTDLRNRRSRGQVPAECLEQKMLYAYATVCTQGDFTLSRK